MLVRADQKMAAGIWENVQNNEAQRGTIEDKNLLILFRGALNTEDTPAPLGVDISDILIPPGSP
jgi:hypothetical protein